VLFHTDGVTETMSGDGEMFGIDRLTEVVRRSHDQTAAQIIGQIHSEVAEFSGRGRFDDDFTCIAVRIESTEN
jgi:sigma-B regulation protein RsbU (phosphoserine phosphatase)